MKLEFDRNIDTDSSLTFIVGPDALANYNGPALTAQIPVSASTETPEQFKDTGGTQQPVAPKQSEVPKENSDQDYIKGPWLWMIVPTDPAGGDGISTEIDSLADASDGAITETYVAQNGVNEGDSIGQLQWTSSEIHWLEHQCRNFVKLAATSLAEESDGSGTLATLVFEVIAVKASTLMLSGALLSNIEGESSRPQVESAHITEPTRLKGDVNADGTVNIQDLVLTASNLGQIGQNPADVNGDGAVNIQDLVLVAGALGNVAAAPSLHPGPLEMLTATDIQLWLSQLQQLIRK